MDVKSNCDFDPTGSCLSIKFLRHEDTLQVEFYFFLNSIKSARKVCIPLCKIENQYA